MTAEAATVEAPHRTRAQVIRDSVTIRLAMGDGSAIADILKENGIVLEGIDWSGSMPNWLLAVVDAEALGCLQVIPARPIGYLEFLFVRPSAKFKLRAIAIRKLIIQGLATLNLNGCHYVGSTLASSNFKFANVIEKLNAVKMYPADMWVKRIR